MKMLKGSIYAIAIALLINTSCTKDIQDEIKLGMEDNSSLKSSSTTKVVNEINTEKMLELINKKRSEGYTCNGNYLPPAPPLKWNATLEQAALQHTNDMANNKFLSHIGSDGLWAGDRLNNLGYSWKKWGENIARGYFESEDEVMEAWLNSEGHCKSLMNPEFTEVGAAMINDKNTYNSWFGYQNYWTQVFANPLNNTNPPDDGDNGNGGSGEDNDDNDNNQSGTTDTTQENIINKKLMLSLINKKRSEGCNCGDTYMPPVAPLDWNDNIEDAARIHSIDMSKNSFLDHTGSDGSSAGDRLNRVDYSWSRWGENIAAGYYESEQEVLNSWFKSPGHCRNLMNGKFKEIGIAKAIDPDSYNQYFGYKSYLTQDFATPLK